MTTAIELYYRCPYCARGRGDLYVDTEFLIEWLLGEAKDTTWQMPAVYPEHPASTFLLFDPRGKGEACVHLISLTFNVRLFGASPNSIRETTIDYDHPWFAQRGQLASDFNAAAYELFSDYENGRTKPAYPCSTQSIGKWLAQDAEDICSDLGLYADGFALAAASPNVFFFDLDNTNKELGSPAFSSI